MYQRYKRKLQKINLTAKSPKDIRLPQFPAYDVEKLAKNVGNNKSAGMDKIPPKLIKL